MITIFGHEREYLSQAAATKAALRLSKCKASKQKVNKTHILYGFCHTFFEPCYITSKELGELASSVGHIGTIYVLHRGTQY